MNYKSRLGPPFMARWKKDARSFTVAVNYIRGRDAYSCSLPKPLAEHMGLPESITFKIRKNGKVSVE